MDFLIKTQVNQEIKEMQEIQDNYILNNSETQKKKNLNIWIY